MNSNTLKFSEIKISKLRKVKPTRKRHISRVSSYTTSNSFNSYSMSVQPLTSLLVVESKNSCPAGYECIGLTDTGQDADLWKDGWFSTVRRYCWEVKLIKFIFTYLFESAKVHPFFIIKSISTCFNLPASIYATRETRATPNTTL